MAYCNQTLAGITLDCSNNMGGIKTVYLANFGDVTVTKGSGDTIDAITMAEGSKFKTYQFRRGTSSMSSELTADETNGLNFVTTTINLVFTKMDTAKRVEMSALAISQLAVIVLDNNGVYWYVTPDDYASASAGTGETGTAKSDRNAFTLTLTSENLTYPIEIEEAKVLEVVE
jgi:hypothetical protein